MPDIGYHKPGSRGKIGQVFGVSQSRMQKMVVQRYVADISYHKPGSRGKIGQVFGVSQSGMQKTVIRRYVAAQLLSQLRPTPANI